MIEEIKKLIKIAVNDGIESDNEKELNELFITLSDCIQEVAEKIEAVENKNTKQLVMGGINCSVTYGDTGKYKSLIKKDKRNGKYYVYIDKNLSDSQKDRELKYCMNVLKDEQMHKCDRFLKSHNSSMKNWAEALGITSEVLTNKIRSDNNDDFTFKEINKTVDVYGLTGCQMQELFFE